MLSTLATCYLFLGGAGAGACTLGGLGAMLVPRDAVAVPGSAGDSRYFLISAPWVYRRLLSPVFAAAFFVLVLGCFALVFDLGQVNRVMLLFELPQFTFLTLGAFSLAVLLAASGFLAIVWGVSPARWRYGFVRAVELVSIVAGCTVMLYTGLLLSSMQAVPFWTTPWLPTAFVASSISCGSAIVIGAACLTESLQVFFGAIRMIVKIDIIAMVVDVIAVALILAIAFGSPYQVAVQGAEELLFGGHSWVFVGGFGICGIVFPLVAEGFWVASGSQTAHASLVVSAAILIGGFILRYGIVTAGMHPEIWV